MKITLFRILVTIALVWGGAQTLYTAFSNLEPLSITVGDYLASPPDAKWLNLTGGRFDITEMSYTGNKYSNRIAEVFVPLHPASADPTGSNAVHVLVASKDPAMIDLATQMRDAKSEVDVIKIIAAHSEVLLEQSITGLIRFGIDLSDKEARQLRELNANLADDFIIVSVNEKPSFGLGAVMLAGGLVMIFFMTKGLRRKKESTPPPMPAAAA